MCCVCIVTNVSELYMCPISIAAYFLNIMIIIFLYIFERINSFIIAVPKIALQKKNEFCNPDQKLKDTVMIQTQLGALCSG